MGSTCKVVCDTKVRTITGSIRVTQSYRLSVSVTECVCNIYGLSWEVCQCDTKLWTVTVLGSTCVCDTKLWTVTGSLCMCVTQSYGLSLAACVCV